MQGKVVLYLVRGRQTASGNFRMNVYSRPCLSQTSIFTDSFECSGACPSPMSHSLFIFDPTIYIDADT